MRPQTTLRLSPEEAARLDAAARRLHHDRAAFIRSVALGAAELVLGSAPPLVLAVEPAALLRQTAAQLEAREPRAAGAASGVRRSSP